MSSRFCTFRCLILTGMIYCMVTSNAIACRCAQQDLAAYFMAAEVVLMAELKQVEALADQKSLHFKPLLPAYKGRPRISAAGEVILVTPESTATCGVQADIGAFYVLFAQRYKPVENAPEGVLSVDSCSGTRIHFSSKLAEPQGFQDVPARFVAQQLNGLAGLEVLREVSANYPQPDDPANSAIVGLLDIHVFSHGGPAHLHRQPQSESEILVQADGYEMLQTRESGYEQAAATVFTVRDGWYRLQLVDGRYGWLPPQEAGTFFPYETLPLKRLSYLTRNWSGFIWPDPGAGLPMRHGGYLNPEIREFPVDVLETTQVGGSTWFRVNILAAEPCSSGSETVSLSGWVPAYGANGQHTAWFWSRGC